MSTFTSKAVKDLNGADVDSEKQSQQLGSSISNIKNSGNSHVPSINTRLNTQNKLLRGYSGNKAFSSNHNPFFSSYDNYFASGNDSIPLYNNDFAPGNNPSFSDSKPNFKKPSLPGESLFSNRDHVGPSLGFSFYLGWLTFILEILVVVFHIFVYRNAVKILSHNENNAATSMT